MDILSLTVLILGFIVIVECRILRTTSDFTQEKISYSNQQLEEYNVELRYLLAPENISKVSDKSLLTADLPFRLVYDLIKDTQTTDFVSLRQYSKEPYQYEGRIFFEMMSGGSWGTCSGTVIGDDLFLTAGHCVMQENSNQLFKKIAFLPQFYTSAKSGAIFWADKVAYFNEWKDSKMLSRDVAIVKVRKNNNNGYESLGEFVGGHADLENCLDVGKNVLVLGYPSRPSDRFDGSRMVETKTEIFKTESWWGEPPMWLYHSDLSSGASGGGVFNDHSVFGKEVCGLNSARIENMNYLISPRFDERVESLLSSFDEF